MLYKIPLVGLSLAIVLSGVTAYPASSPSDSLDGTEAPSTTGVVGLADTPTDTETASEPSTENEADSTPPTDTETTNDSTDTETESATTEAIPPTESSTEVETTPSGPQNTSPMGTPTADECKKMNECGIADTSSPLTFCNVNPSCPENVDISDILSKYCSTLNTPTGSGGGTQTGSSGVSSSTEQPAAPSGPGGSSGPPPYVATAGAKSVFANIAILAGAMAIVF